MRIRYAITHVTKDGLRVLTMTNQGRFHYDRPEDAAAALETLAPSLREKILGDQADTLRVWQVECYDHGDATRTVFDTLDWTRIPAVVDWPTAVKAISEIATQIGIGFHPDTDPESYEPPFVGDEVDRLRDTLAAVFDFLPDPYEIALAAWRAAGITPPADDEEEDDGKRCCKCGGEIRTVLLPPEEDERCVFCADPDPDDPDADLLKGVQ